MISKISCIISLVFIISTLYFNFSLNKYSVIKDYQDTLNEEQLKIYNKIANERLEISVRGYLLGLSISLLVIVINYNVYKVNKNPVVCLVGMITFLVHYFYYNLAPKSDWMLLHVDKEQNKDWLKMYKTMKRNYHISFVVGIISVMLLANSFKC
tara:strand:+ start:44 stop:505 length:462 start_codon:yes stop_codon:yes gene_type:complete